MVSLNIIKYNKDTQGHNKTASNLLVLVLNHQNHVTSHRVFCLFDVMLRIQAIVKFHSRELYTPDVLFSAIEYENITVFRGLKNYWIEIVTD